MNRRTIKKIGVTGASGFVGKHLCEHLVTRGYDVLAVVRGDCSGLPKEVSIKQAPDPSEWVTDNVFRDCDALIHLIGRAHVLNETARDPLHEFRRTNVELLSPLVLSAARAGVSRIVFASSIGVNGNETRSGKPFVETDSARPHNFYSLTKLEGEQELAALAKRHGIEYVIVRPVLVFGPDAPGNFATLLRLASSSMPLPFGRFNARRSIVSVWNLANFLELCATHQAAANELFLIADEQPLTLPEILSHLRIGMGKKPMIWPVPLFVLKIAMFLLGREGSLEKLQQELTVSSAKASMTLNWQPVLHTEEGLKKTGAAYQKKRS